MTRHKITLTAVLSLLIIVSTGQAFSARQSDSKQSGQQQQSDKDKQKSTVKSSASSTELPLDLLTQASGRKGRVQTANNTTKAQTGDKAFTEQII